ncbi:1465_t:CDS:1 [Paraglomus brasilianum]|uniref:1465_t:CDS:1 n=1 Tax=Paraglomus brasilianum TaxID=144538 RepID=A0A9N8YYP5_9GLOM|nr:1465_t:CDS:1 [Paraglomus brasilianum]
MTNTPSSLKQISNISKHSCVKTGRIDKHTHSPIKARKSLPLEWYKSETAVEKVTRWLELDDEETFVRSPKKYAPTNYGMMEMPVRTTRNANMKATDNPFISCNQSYFSQSRMISSKISMQHRDIRQKRSLQNTKTANNHSPRSLFRTSELLFSRAFPRLFAWLSTESDSESEDEVVYATMASKRSVAISDIKMHATNLMLPIHDIKKKHGGKIKRVPESSKRLFGVFVGSW